MSIRKQRTRSDGTMWRVLVLSFLPSMFVGLICGWFLSRAVWGSEDSALTTGPRADGGPALSFMRVDHRNLPEAPDSDALPPGLDADSRRAFLDELDRSDTWVVPESALKGLRLKGIEDGKISEKIKDILALTPEEVEEVNQVMRRVDDLMNNAEMATIELVSSSEKHVTFRAPALGDTGRQIEQVFRDGIRGILGSNDAEFFFDQLGGPHNITSSWDNFGKLERTITFSIDDRPDDRVLAQFQVRYDSDEVVAVLAEHGIRGIGDHSTGRTVGTLHPRPVEYGPFTRNVGRSTYLLQLLPPDLAPYFEGFAEPGRQE